jgi:RecA/RadA recombinase
MAYQSKKNKLAALKADALVEKAEKTKGIKAKEIKSAAGIKGPGFKGGLVGRLKTACKTELAGIMSDLDDMSPRDFISAGNFLFNCLLSADPFKGIPSGKIVTLAGPPGCGKTFTMLEILKNAQALGYTAVLYDTEMANNDMNALKARGLDIENLLYIPVDTVEALKTSLLNLLEEVGPTEKVIIGIDSLGNLSTEKEMRDSIDGSDKKDMTRAAMMKALFRTVTLKAGLKQVPIIGINHTYVNPGSFIPQNIVAGGSGGLYMSSIIVQFTKAQDKDTGGVIGCVVTAKTDKNRFAKERSKVKFSINFNTGMNPYSGLLGWCEEEKIFKKEGRSYIYNGTKLGPKDLNKPFWDAQLKGELGALLCNKFKYGSGLEDIEVLDMEEDLNE